MGKLRLCAFVLPVIAAGQQFYLDDPLEREPPPRNVTTANVRRVGEYYDFMRSTFGKPGERQAPGKLIAAQGVNTLGEVMDGAWYVNRHYRKRMSIPDLVRGAGDSRPPSRSAPWDIVSAKTEGVTPGFTIRDATGQKYMIKFDPLGNIELATAAEAVCTRFFHALGYHVPEIYIVYFDRKDVRIAKGTTIKRAGRERPMNQRDLDEIFFGVPRDKRKGYRAVASRYIPGKIIKEFHYEGTRSDDPNDIVPHEHRRDLRGLFVFAAWLGHNDIKCLQTCDSLVTENGVSFIKHHLIDFGASLGSDSFTTKSPRAGYEHLFRWRPTLAQIFTLGFYLPGWARAEYPLFQSVGNFEYRVFEPEEWKPNYPATIFDNRLPDDEFWAARQVMAFTEPEIRALVETGQYSDPKAVDWLVKCLTERRDKIGRTYFAKVLPLDRFRIEKGRLEFDDLEVQHRFASPRNYRIHWTRFDNLKRSHSAVANRDDRELPAEVKSAAEGTYFAARIMGLSEKKTVRAYLRKDRDGHRIVGVERSW